MAVYNNVNELIGDTPLIKLNRLNNYPKVEIFAKLESFNPGGSIKDRIAQSMIDAAEKNGELKAGGTIVEPTSGNIGIGLALIGAERGYDVILVMPETMSQERRTLLKSFGAKLILTPGKKGMKGAIKKAEEIVSSNRLYFMARQFENPANPAIHQKTTAKEILKDTEGKIDYFTAGVGTGGTITGIASVLKKHDKDIKIAAVEPDNSAVISGKKANSHKIQGIGAGFIPKNLNQNLIDRVIKIKDDEAYQTARDLAKKEGLLVGISSGANVKAALKLADELDKRGEKDKKINIVTVLPDTGERYLSTGLFN